MSALIVVSTPEIRQSPNNRAGLRFALGLCSRPMNGASYPLINEDVLVGAINFALHRTRCTPVVLRDYAMYYFGELHIASSIIQVSEILARRNLLHIVVALINVMLSVPSWRRNLLER